MTPARCACRNDLTLGASKSLSGLGQSSSYWRLSQAFSEMLQILKQKKKTSSNFPPFFAHSCPSKESPPEPFRRSGQGPQRLFGLAQKVQIFKIPTRNFVCASQAQHICGKRDTISLKKATAAITHSCKQAVSMATFLVFLL